MKSKHRTQAAFISALANTLSQEIPADRGLFIARIEGHLGGALKKTIDSNNTNSVIFVLDNQSYPMLLKAELGKNTATHKEATWYEYLVELGQDETSLYLGAVKDERFALLFLRHIEGAMTLDEWAVRYPTKTGDFGNLVGAMLSYDSLLFNMTAKSVPHHLVEQSLTRKYQTRRKDAAGMKYLDELLSNRIVSINGERHLTPDFALMRLAEDPRLWQRLTPKQVGLIHGDLHTGNVLIGNDEKLYYVDPNGNLEMPLEYDIAKVLHSVHGQYPVIMQGGYEVKTYKNNEYEFNLKQELIYSAAHKKLRDELDYEQYVRSTYIEALHFATMLPHHARSQNETIALFLRSAQLFGELFSILNISS